MPILRNLVARFLLGVAVVALCSSCRQDGARNQTTPNVPPRPETPVESPIENSTGQPPTASRGAARHLTLGAPTRTGARLDSFLLLKPQFVVSYNKTLGHPNWVAWQLSDQDLGSTPRADEFHPDPDLPSSFDRISGSDYKRSGFDRGHNCPSGDRTATPDDNFATFAMTNIVPQAPDNNQGPWADLEEYCRDLVRDGHTLFITSVPHGQSGDSIANGRVSVPAFMSKVVVVMPRNASPQPQSVTPNTRVICVTMPNRQGIRNDAWRDYRVSIDALEGETGYDFLPKVDASVQASIEAKTDSE